VKKWNTMEKMGQISQSKWFVKPKKKLTYQIILKWINKAVLMSYFIPEANRKFCSIRIIYQHLNFYLMVIPVKPFSISWSFLLQLMRLGPVLDYNLLSHLQDRWVIGICDILDQGSCWTIFDFGWNCYKTLIACIF
jgi:hypothetical protein